MPEKTRLVVASPADEIARILKEGILSGVYPPGTRLMQAELSEQFAISRTPVREALRTLQAQNLVRIVPSRGATVILPSIEQLREIYEVRAELEGFAAELAASRATASELVNLQALLAPSDEARGDAAHLPEAEEGRTLDANEMVHEEIHRLAHNHYLLENISKARQYFPKRIPAQPMGEASCDYAPVHAEIVRAIKARDGRAAKTLMSQHILDAGSSLFSELERRGLAR